MKQQVNSLNQKTFIKNEIKPKCLSLALIFTLLSLSLGSAHAQIISTVVGNGTEGYNDAVPATAGQISAVSHVSVDNSGNLYFPDYYLPDGASRIRIVNAAGIIGTIAGTGIPGYSGDGGPAVSAQFRSVSVVRPDNLGNLYVVDQLNHVIRKIDAAGDITTVVGNGNGAGSTIGGYSGDGGPATDAELSQPGDIVIDNAGNLFISDGMNKVIRKVTPAGIISTIAGTGTDGYSGDGGLATSASINPYGLAVDASGNLYFVQSSSAVDGNAIRKISPSGIITTICGTGAVGYSGDGGPATAATLQDPSFLAIDASGNLFVADRFNYVVRKISTDGIITTVAGTGAAGYTGDGGPATAAKLDFPAAVAVDNSNNLYIPDRLNYVIRKVSAPSTGVKSNHLKEMSVAVFPNPNDGTFTVSCSGIATYVTDVQMRISNMLGQLVYLDEFSVKDGIFRKEVSFDKCLPIGMYILEVSNKEQSVVSHMSLLN